MANAKRTLASLRRGREVQVRTRFDGSWAGGFVICGVIDGDYRVKRCSDGYELPAVSPEGDLRTAAHSGADWAGRS